MSSLSTIWAAAQVVGGIGFLIFVHELGHFLVARWNGVRCDVFSIGFGPPIFSYKGKKTEYRLAWIPLGGFVSMAGEHPGQDTSDIPDDELLQSKSVLARMAVFGAGVTMNMIFAVVLFSIAFGIGVRFIAPEVGSVPAGSPAWHAGLQRGDTILQIDDKEIINFDQIALNIAFANRGEAVKLKIERDGEVLERDIEPVYQEDEGIQWIGIRPATQTRIKVEKDGPAWKAGMRDGDRIVRIGEVTGIESNTALIEALSKVTSSTFDVVYEQDGAEKTATIDTSGQKEFLLGIVAAQISVKDVRKFRPSDGSTPSVARELGVQEGDRLSQLAGKPVFSLRRTIERTRAWDEGWGPTVDVTFLRKSGDGWTPKVFKLKKDDAEAFFDGIAPRTREALIGEIQPGSAAEEAGIVPGSTITGIDGEEVTSWQTMAEGIRAAKGKPIDVKWKTPAGEAVTKKITPREVTAIAGKVGFGFDFKLSDEVKYGFVKSCKVGAAQSKEITIKVILMVKALFTRQVSARKLGGPILIAQASFAYVDRFGFGRFLYFLGLLSVNLVILNLLPVPVLDGGHLMFLGIEAIKGSPLSDNVQGVSTYIGFFMILALIVFVIFNDIMRLIP